jgi:hypothetical protein
MDLILPHKGCQHARDGEVQLVVENILLVWSNNALLGMGVVNVFHLNVLDLVVSDIVQFCLVIVEISVVDKQKREWARLNQVQVVFQLLVRGFALP